MGNNPSAPAKKSGGGGSGSGDGPPNAPSPHHFRSQSSRQHQRHNSSARQQFHTHSGDSTISASHSSTPRDTPSFSTQLAPSPQRSLDSPAHQRTQSLKSTPSRRHKEEDSMGNLQSGEANRDKEARKRGRGTDQHTSPVQVPSSGQQRRNRGPVSGFEPSGPPASNSQAIKSNLIFPPRLPLPIGEEVLSPGSPIITPDEGLELHEEDVDGALPHVASLLSHGTLDEDDEAAFEEPEESKGKVPTLVEWKGHAEKVYVTGTFAGWSRKYRMHRDPNNPGILNATLELTPGTHHVKFIVDGEMQLSNDLPTAVDFTNILVNYIEVSADDIPTQTPKDSLPDGLHPPLTLPDGVQETDFAATSETKPEAEESQAGLLPSKPVHFGTTIPTYLIDLDRVESSNRWQRGNRHMSEVPAPPTLPLFLGKPILNGTTPMKDDSSVLNMPNHTVLNHLATSQIKGDVLATSLTTRYKRKYVTTITYMPTREDE